MAEKPMTWDEWAASVGGDVAIRPVHEAIADHDDFLVRANAALADDEFVAAGKAMTDGYYAYICAFIDAL